MIDMERDYNISSGLNEGSFIKYSLIIIMTYVFTIIAVAFTMLLLFWFHKIKKYGHLPTSKYLIPFIGHAFRVDIKNSLENQRVHFIEAKSKYRVFWVFGWPIISSIHIQMNEEILKSMAFINKSYNVWNDWLGSGLLISNGEKWKTRRRLLTPAFHFDILKSNLRIINQHAFELVSYINEHISSDPIDFAVLSKHFSLNVICETAMGVKCNIYNEFDITPESEYVDAVKNLLRLFMKRFMTPWFHNSFFYKYFSLDSKQFYHYLDIAQNYVKKVIQNRIDVLSDSEEIGSPIFLDILISAYKRGDIDKEGILEEVNTFLFEGHDTVSSAISWTAYLLGRNERVQKKVIDEVKLINSKELDIDDLSHMKYLECVIKESLRLHPPVPFFVRNMIKDSYFLNGSVKIPAGSDFVFHTYHMHRDETIWKDPLCFYPERFLEEDIEKRNPFAYIPFSAGPRNCIGQRFAMMELKVVMFYLLRNFKFVSIHAESELEERSEIIHRSANGLWVKMSRHENI